MRIFRLIIMLVIGIFPMHPAYAQPVPASNPVFAAGNWVLVNAGMVMPMVQDEILFTVAPANLPGHLNYAGSSNMNQKIGFIKTAGIIPIDKGGFQNVEIVLKTVLLSPDRIEIRTQDG